MANMSYCAFENTSSDLRQCLSMLYEAREEGVSLRAFIATRSSREEGRSVERLIAIAEELLELVQMMDEDDA